MSGAPWGTAPCFFLCGFGNQPHRKAVSPRVVPSVFVIPGLLLAERAQGGVFVHPPILVHLGRKFIISPADLPCLGQAGRKRKHNTTSSACTLLGLGACLCCWELAPLQLLQGPTELDVTLVRIISCGSL